MNPVAKTGIMHALPLYSTLKNPEQNNEA